MTNLTILDNTTALVNPDTMSDAALNKLLGVDTGGSSYPVMTALKINTLPEDDNGNTLPMGTFYLTQQDETVYSKSAEIRVIMPSYQYVHYDPENNEVVARSIMAPRLDSDFVSDNGKIRCGKLTKAQAEKQPLTPEQQKIQKDVKCKMSLWVYVSYKGKTKDGREVEVTDVPAVWTLSQSAFAKAQDLLESFTKSKKSPLKYPVTVTLDKQKNGSVIYYLPVFSISNEPAPIPSTLASTIEGASTYMKEINTDIKSKYDSILEGKVLTATTERVAGKVLKGKRATVDTSDLDDEIPF